VLKQSITYYSLSHTPLASMITSTLYTNSSSVFCL
jgi:hypothetical protein